MNFQYFSVCPSGNILLYERVIQIPGLVILIRARNFCKD
jgi:hypothetical protein